MDRQSPQLLAESEDMLLFICFGVSVHHREVVKSVKTLTTLERLGVVDVLLAKLIPLHVCLWLWPVL